MPVADTEAGGSGKREVDPADGGYRIVTTRFNEQGDIVEPASVCPVYETGSEWPRFAIVWPAVDNTQMDMSPYEQSVFADAIDAVRAVGLTFDAMTLEVDNGKMRAFLSDVMFDQKVDGEGAEGLDTLREGGLHDVPEGHVD